MRRETWKDIAGFEGLYQVSDRGRVRSLRKRRIIGLHSTSSCYLQAHLYKKGKAHYRYVHHLVAETFLTKPNIEKAVVNHLDENKQNNHVSNLEWCTHSHNHHWGSYQSKQREAKIKNSKTKPVKMSSPDGSVVAVFLSLHMAEDATGVGRVHISDCCKRKQEQAGGFVWSYI